MRWVVLLAAAALVAGCADTSGPTDGAPRRVQGDGDHVSILGGRLDALPLAIGHCARFGRSAQWSHADGDRSVYDCVKNP